MISNVWIFICNSLKFLIFAQKCQQNLKFQVSDAEPYVCESGVSSTWVKEFHNARGDGVGQVILEESLSGDCTHSYCEHVCRAKCEALGGSAYNYQTSGNKACRCYGKVAADSLVIEPATNWKFCKKNEGNFTDDFS